MKTTKEPKENIKMIRSGSKNRAYKNEEEVQQNPDEHIDQDYPGFPHPRSDKKSIKSKTVTEKKSI